MNVPGTQTLARIARAYDLSLSELLGDWDPMGRTFVFSHGDSSGQAPDPGVTSISRGDPGANAVAPTPGQGNGEDLARYVADVALVRRTLRTLPSGPAGIPIKLALLNAIETAAAQTGAELPAPFFLLRRAVITGEI